LTVRIKHFFNELDNITVHFQCSWIKGCLKNALSYGGASSTVGDPVLFECKTITTDCFGFKKCQLSDIS